jgi:hypothetical protein
VTLASIADRIESEWYESTPVPRMRREITSEVLQLVELVREALGDGI